MKANKHPRGFTLLELMMALGIVGILGAIAYPSYQKQMERTRRADAEGALLGLANAMERHFTETNSYLDAAGTAGTPAPTGYPRIYPTQSPLDGATKYYDLTINAATATTYTLRATPISNSPQAHDKCGTLT
ncbi:type IV pilin protein, partial [Methylomagnum sp.]